MNENEVLERHDSIFRNRNSSPEESPICFGLECGPGWYGLIDSLCEDIESVTSNVVAQQVKEKFGGLRFYYTGTDDLGKRENQIVRHIIRRYELKASRTCEKCGGVGQLSSSGGWRTTLCERHRSEGDEPHEVPLRQNRTVTSEDQSAFLKQLSAFEEYVKRFQDETFSTKSLKKAVLSEQGPREWVINRAKTVMDQLSNSLSALFRPLQNFATRRQFARRKRIPANDKTRREEFWSSVANFFRRFMHEWNLFKRFRPKLSYTLRLTYNTDPDHSKYAVGDIQSVQVERSMGSCDKGAEQVLIEQDVEPGQEE